MKNCEFCRELAGDPDNRFRQIYKDLTDTRVVAETMNFVAIPTLGQIFPGSLLIVPRDHIETCASLDIGLQYELIDLIETVSSVQRRFGEPIFFEHGAMACTGGSCGIYHAHLHIVPLPIAASPSVLFPEHRGSVGNLLQGFADLNGCRQYLLMGNQIGVLYAEADQLLKRPASQHFRRRLTEWFGMDRPWDWRKSTSPEGDLIATIEAFRGQDIAQRTIDSP